jgi:hypothetical protein
MPDAATQFAQLLLLVLVTILASVAINHGPGALYTWFKAKFLGIVPAQQQAHR